MGTLFNFDPCAPQFRHSGLGVETALRDTFYRAQRV